MGRGKYYHRWRQIGESIEHKIYAGGWASRIAHRLGLQGALHIDQREFYLDAHVSASPLKLAFASDLHAGPLTDSRLLDSFKQTVKSFAPDVLLLGGDYVSLHHRYVDSFAERISQLDVPLGIYGVFGNHDLWLDDQYIKRILEAAGVRFLINESMVLPRPYSHVSICGLDEPGTGAPDASKMFANATDHRLVIMHSPLGLRYLAGHSFDIAFCGHTHGGQIALPSGRPIVLPSGSGERRFSNGHFTLATGGKLIASRGIGMSDIPIRLFAPSEVHLCTINFVK
jgi:predicted MPP superfamily phosphohydrolase